MRIRKYLDLIKLKYYSKDFLNFNLNNAALRGCFIAETQIVK